ncbi:MAG: hypothetical protein OEZ59_10855 [Deltaproteobacteria bacterium]|nr:hypothetical protein [Deltaproteobacteria bacterium]
MPPGETLLTYSGAVFNPPADDIILTGSVLSISTLFGKTPGETASEKKTTVWMHGIITEQTEAGFWMYIAKKLIE